MTSFKDLQLNPKILTALENKGYTTPTPIQTQAIPHTLAGKDILGIAQTGTGKTAAFSLPILHNLVKSGKSVRSGSVRALILTPTRELASQISENIEAYNEGLNLRHAVIYGGVSDKPQITALQQGVDILIATPGRLMDLMSQGYIRLMHLEILVLDEADRMLDMGFIVDIKKITARLPANRQTLFFSATMPKAIIDLAGSLLQDPAKIEITPESTTVDRIDQRINFVSNHDRPKLLKHIVNQKDATMVVVFCRTKHGADDVEEFLEKNRIPAAAIHGNKDQDARERALNNFKDGTIKVLVATDVAARGIDIPTISHVINYDIPSDPESYVHRIGRTARAGRKGIAISFCDPKDDTLLREVEKTINFNIPVDDSHPFAGGKAAGNKARNSAPSNVKNRKPERKKQTKTSETNKGTANKTQHRQTKTSPKKKKGGLFGLLAGLFSAKKSASKPHETSATKGNKKRKPATSKTRQSTDENRSPSQERPQRARTQKPRRQTERPEREASDRKSPQRARPERSTENKPRPTGATRKISSGKKPTQDTDN